MIMIGVVVLVKRAYVQALTVKHTNKQSQANM